MIFLNPGVTRLTGMPYEEEVLIIFGLKYFFHDKTTYFTRATKTFRIRFFPLLKKISDQCSENCMLFKSPGEKGVGKWAACWNNQLVNKQTRACEQTNNQLANKQTNRGLWTYSFWRGKLKICLRTQKILDKYPILDKLMLLKQNLMAYLIYNKVARLEAKTKILAEMLGYQICLLYWYQYKKYNTNES